MREPSPIRVLHVVYRMNRGGTETCIMHFLRRADPQQFQTDFLVHAAEPGDYDDEIRTLGGHVFVGERPSRPWRHCRRFRQILTEHGPYAVVHAHHQTWGPLLRLAGQAGVPVRITHSHNDIRELKPGSMIEAAYWRWARWLSRRHATHGLAVAGVAAEAYFGPQWQADPRWQVLVSGRDFAPFAAPVDRPAVRTALGLAPDAVVVGHVGRFVAQKNHAFFLAVAAEVARQEPRARFLLIGDGPLRPALERQAAAELGDRVLFAGVRRDVPQLLGIMDALLFPSLFEGLPGAVVEAQAAGLPCVISDVIAGETDMIPELLTRLALTQPPAAWAAAVLAAVRAPRPLTRAQALVRAQTSRFDLDANVRALAALYRGDRVSAVR